MGEAQRGRPTGTVSFVFTDVEGSTVLWERHPEAMRAALVRHDEIVRGVIGAHGGFVFSTAGDAFSAAFWTPGEATRAALEVQRALQKERWPQDTVLRVRMAVHAGTAQERDGDYFGATLNRTARLMALGHGGQVLVSSAVQELVRDDLPEGVSLVALGEHALRGLSRPEAVFQLTASDLAVQFPPLRAATAVAGNLPSPSTSFVGRIRELKGLALEVSTRRLVSLVGPGGIGKTRLSIEVAAALSDEFPDGVWFVELAPVGEPAAVVQAIASVVSVSPEAGATLLDAMVDVLSARRALVVLDNCEHVIDAAAEIAAALGQGAPSVTVLATSREPLGVDGEQVWGVAALDASVEAVELFCERARAADHSFDPSEADLDLIAGICERLDGMPLAVELAASRSRSMSLVQLNDRLADRFSVLRRSARGAVAQRQQTLRATVEWSYRLLSVHEQLLFDRLSVFPGSFSLDAAEIVCGREPVDSLDVFDLLSSLVDKSLVILQRDRDGGRYRMLETLRQYGTERLADQGDIEAQRKLHLAHYVTVSEHARGLVQGDSYQRGTELFEQEWDNLRAALSWALESGDEPAVSTLIVAPFWYAFMFQRHELGAWAEQALTRIGADAVLHGIAGLFAFQAGEIDNADSHCLAGLAAAPFPTHPDSIFCWQAKSSCDAHRGLRSVLTEDIASYEAAAAGVADPFAAAMQYSLVALFPVTSDEAAQLVAKAKTLRVGLNNPCLDVQIGVAEGIATYAAGKRSEAVELLIEARRRAEHAGPYPQAIVAWVIALRAAAPGLHIDPTAAYLEAVTRLHDLREWGNLWLTVESLAAWWARIDKLEQAGRTLGYLEATGRRFMDLASRRERAVATVKAHPQGESWLAAGARTDRDQLITYLLDQLEHTR